MAKGKSRLSLLHRETEDAKQQSKGRKYCWFCGTYTPPDAAVYPDCGMSLLHPETPAEELEDETDKPSGGMLHRLWRHNEVLIAFFIFAVIILGAVWASAGPPVQSPNQNPTPTPVAMPTIALTPVAMPTSNDISSYYTKLWQGSGFIVTQPFTKSTNVRGNDVYMGIMKNATLSGAPPMTVVMELTKNQAEAKQVYDNYVAAEQGQGFTLRPDWVAQLKVSTVPYTEIWYGQNGLQQFATMYRYGSDVQS